MVSKVRFSCLSGWISIDRKIVLEGGNGRLIDRCWGGHKENLKEALWSEDMENLSAMTIFKILREIGQWIGDYGARGANPGEEFYFRSLISTPSICAKMQRQMKSKFQVI